MQSFEIRVGNTVFDKGFRNGFEENGLRVYSTGVSDENDASVITCYSGYRVGRHVSIMNNESKVYSVILLCEVDVIIN